MGNNVRLIEESHTYINDNNPNIKYTSVTTVLGNYKEKFDEEFHASRVAARKGVDITEVINEWREINKKANEYGTKVHHILERFLLASNGIYSPRDSFEKEVINAFKDVCLLENLGIINSKGVKPEYVMSIDFTKELGIAGTSDIIEDFELDKFNVWDFKTNKKFNYYSKYGQYMYFPLDHLSYCEYNTYALQLSIYALMYERETGKKFNRAGLFYWDKELKTFTMIPVPYMKLEAQQVIEHFKIKHLNIL